MKIEITKTELILIPENAAEECQINQIYNKIEDSVAGYVERQWKILNISFPISQGKMTSPPQRDPRPTVCD